MWLSNMAYKRILTIQDISCVGQCSMTVAMPILSACGHETCILPTALLSTHTGGFGKPVVQHLTETMAAMRQHWKSCDIRFDAILVGYLGSVEAVRETAEIAKELLAPEGKLIVDPAMADHGRRYSGLSEEYAAAMQQLCARADILIPNVTEGAMLSGMEYREEPEDSYVNEILMALPGKCVVMTGVGTGSGTTGAAVRDGENLFRVSHKKVDRAFHGTGDMFAAAFVGALMGGKDVKRAVQIAGDFVLRAIEITLEAPAHWYGVRFESALGYLQSLLEN